MVLESPAHGKSSHGVNCFGPTVRQPIMTGACDKVSILPSSARKQKENGAGVGDELSSLLQRPTHPQGPKDLSRNPISWRPLTFQLNHLGEPNL